jgi:hypothetical protein
VCVCVSSRRASEQQHENECGEISLRRQTKKSQTKRVICGENSLSAKVRYKNKIPFSP